MPVNPSVFAGDNCESDDALDKLKDPLVTYGQVLDPANILSGAGARRLLGETFDAASLKIVLAIYYKFVFGDDRVSPYGPRSTNAMLTIADISLPSELGELANIRTCHPENIRRFVPTYNQCIIERQPGEYCWKAEELTMSRGLKNPDAYDDLERVKRALAAHPHLTARGNQLDNPFVREGEFNNWCGGYAESGSVREIVDSMRQVSLELLDMHDDDIKFVDIGVGSTCRVQLQVFLEVGCLTCDGIEYDPIRAWCAQSGLDWFCKELEGSNNEPCQRLAALMRSRVTVRVGDLDNFTPMYWNTVTHIYSYDTVFNPQLFEKMVRKVHNSRTVVWVCSINNKLNTKYANDANSVTKPRIESDTDCYKWTPDPGSLRTNGNEYIAKCRLEGLLDDPIEQGVWLLKLPWGSSRVNNAWRARGPRLHCEGSSISLEPSALANAISRPAHIYIHVGNVARRTPRRLQASETPSTTATTATATANADINRQHQLQLQQQLIHLQERLRVSEQVLSASKEHVQHLEAQVQQLTTSQHGQRQQRQSHLAAGGIGTLSTTPTHT